jgi:DNA-directed RNA polymerase subunit E'/Rpb7|tara:strand:+ start:962 stop:1591 length:630 start_codon:yes stop_codon:yes gene_type:complete
MDPVYNKIIISKKVYINFSHIDKNINNKLLNILKNDIENKCITEGFIKNNSIKILKNSSGVVQDNTVGFNITLECMAANPVQSMKFICKVKSITKVGIRAEIDDPDNPFIIFLARDHHYNNTEFSKIKEDDYITVRVLGQRFELNDTNISVIAEFIELNVKEQIKKELNNIKYVQSDKFSNVQHIDDGEKIKIKMKKSTAKSLKNLVVN